MSGPTCNYSFRESTFNVICQVRRSEKKKQMDEEREVAGHKKVECGRRRKKKTTAIRKYRNLILNVRRQFCRHRL